MRSDCDREDHDRIRDAIRVQADDGVCGEEHRLGKARINHDDFVHEGDYIHHECADGLHRKDGEE